jgi:hypothetical protein
MTELAEGARLEIVCAVNSGTEGSNPSLSAILLRGSPAAGATPPAFTADRHTAGAGARGASTAPLLRVPPAIFWH